MRWWHLALAVALVAIAAMWAYALFFASASNSNIVSDRAWAATNEQLCAAQGRRLAALPPAKTATSPRTRAVVLDEANVIVAAMVDELRSNSAHVSGRQQHLIALWLADWDVYLRDRRDYAAVLHRGLNRPFAVTLREGTPVTERLDGFADINAMKSCETPLDV